MPLARTIAPALTLTAVAAILWSVSGWSQPPTNATPPTVLPPPAGLPLPPELPAPAPARSPSAALTRLIDQRRRQLLAEQQRLEESAAFYGRNHPSSQSAVGQLATVQQQLKLWRDPHALPDPSELSELVLRLTIKVDTLERQVAALRRSPGGR